jgi:fluoroquinolone resistance protein
MMAKIDISFHDDQSFSNLISGEIESSFAGYENCMFNNCDFSNIEFSSVIFSECIFYGCNISLAKLTNCQVNNVVFNDCKLLGVDFSNCSDTVFSVRFDNCQLDYCSFAGKKMVATPFTNSSVKNVDFSGSNLTGSSFSGCDLVNSVFNRTQLKEVDFSSAIHYIIDPETNNINRAKFSADGLSGLLTRYDLEIL